MEGNETNLLMESMNVMFQLSLVEKSLNYNVLVKIYHESMQHGSELKGLYPKFLNCMWGPGCRKLVYKFLFHQNPEFHGHCRQVSDWLSDTCRMQSQHRPVQASGRACLLYTSPS